MQKLTLFLISIFIAACSFCQSNSLTVFEQQRINYNKKGMLVLGSWSAANIIISAFAANTSNRQAHYFHQMNIIWNSFNLGLATLSYLSATKDCLEILKADQHESSFLKRVISKHSPQSKFIGSVFSASPLPKTFKGEGFNVIGTNVVIQEFNQLTNCVVDSNLTLEKGFTATDKLLLSGCL